MEGQETGKLVSPPAAQETGKLRAARIPLDYYKKPNRLERWKGRFLALGVLAALLWWGASSLLRSDQGRSLYDRGPVAAVHATWEDKCDACHESFRPISTEALARSFAGAADAGDAKCQKCHAAPPHHGNPLLERDTPPCAGCHVEHRGRDAALARVTDKDCTRCHANLAAHVDPADAALIHTPHLAVSRFPQDHPPFPYEAGRRPGSDKLKFSHGVHLALGMNTEFTLAKIANQEDRARYRRDQGAADDAALVKLECQACHRTDPGDWRERSGGPAGAGLAQRTDGKYMLPIVYETQCAACHPLTFQPGDPADPNARPKAVPHRLQPADVREYLEAHYTAAYVQGTTGLFERAVPVRRFPGKLPDADVEPVRKVVGQRVHTAERYVFSEATCRKCHPEPPAAGQFAPEKIESPGVPAVWHKHAVFDHAAHKAMDCLLCHGQAVPAGKGEPVVEKSPTVMLPGIDTCRQCHAPAGRSGGTPHGGARFDCAECHRYHHGDDPLHGPGAAARAVDARHKLTVEEFLSGHGRP